MRGRLPAVPMASILVLSGVLAACSGGTASLAAGEIGSARGICDASVPGTTVTAIATTLGKARSANFGGPYPGVVPAAHAFPELPNSQRAAWCWTPGTVASPIPGDDDPAYALYLAVAGGRNHFILSMQLAHRPVGLPSYD